MTASPPVVDLDAVAVTWHGVVQTKFNKRCISKSLEKQRYKVESIYQGLEKAFLNYNLKKIQKPDGTICFVGNGNPKDYKAFGCIITSLKEKAWFMDCVIKWIWYNSDDGESEDDFTVEDVLYHYAKKPSII